MTRDEMIKIHGMLRGNFSDFQVSDIGINAWLQQFRDLPASELASAVQFFIDTAETPFAPNPSIIRGVLRKLRGEHTLDAALAWKDHTRSALATEAYRVWGGDARFGALPDPRFCNNPISAQTALDFARKEFIEIYEQLAASAKVTKHNKAIEQRTAERTLERIQNAKTKQPQIGY